MEEEDEDSMVLSMMQQCVSSVVLAELPKKRKRDHRELPREGKREFRHEHALQCILYDYLGPKPLFNGREFETMFRVSKRRFQCLMEDFGNIPFYSQVTDCFGKKGASMEARLLLPLKSMAYGVPPHTFMDYFSMSKTLAKDCYNTFQDTMIELYLKEYVRVPTCQDLKAITQLHKSVHGVEGMLGSLDCMHTYWDKCPVAWQGAFSNGAKKKPSIVLEAACDYHLWFWHASYGYAGTLNDINIINLSPLTEAFISGEMAKLETEVVPFQIGSEEFNQLYLLVDGIYPSFSRFVKGYKEPIGEFEKALTTWQESARKDIERAFGVLQLKFQCVARPIKLRALKRIEALVTTALILHNMCVSDRVMEGNCRANYNPANSVAVLKDGSQMNVDQPPNLHDVQARCSGGRRTQRLARTGVANSDEEIVPYVTRRRRWMDLQNKEEAARLHKALMSKLGNDYIANKRKHQKN